MNQLYSIKNQLMKIYSEKSRYIDMAVRFCLAFAVILYLNKHLGYMATLDKLIVVLGISVVCAFLPMGFVMVIATIVLIAHVYALSVVLAGCVALLCFGIYIVHFRFSSEYTLLLLLTPIACVLHVPYVIPVAAGLVATPVACIPMVCGVIVYYLIGIINQVGGELAGEDMSGMIQDAINFALGLSENADMIALVVVLCVTMGTVYIARRIPVAYVWQIACGSGAVISIIASYVMKSVLENTVAIGALVLGNLLAVAVGIIISFLFMSVDYKKTEVVEFEDDEYHYYVKAIPKLHLEEVEEHKVHGARRGKNKVGSINENNIEEIEDTQDKTTVIETGEIERELRKNARERKTYSGEGKKGNFQANYKLLAENMKRELKQ